VKIVHIEVLFLENIIIQHREKNMYRIKCRLTNVRNNFSGQLMTDRPIDGSTPILFPLMVSALTDAIKLKKSATIGICRSI